MAQNSIIDKNISFQFVQTKEMIQRYYNCNWAKILFTNYSILFTYSKKVNKVILIIHNDKTRKVIYHNNIN